MPTNAGNLSFGGYGNSPNYSQGGGGWNPYSSGNNPYTMNMPQGGGSNVGNEGAGMGGGDPFTAAINFAGGLLNLIRGRKVEKRRNAAYEKHQKEYQARADSLFPELSKESLTYQSKESDMGKAANAAIMYRMKNMFSDWGMPEGRRGGNDVLNAMFSSLFNRITSPEAQAPPINPLPGPGSSGPNNPMPGPYMPRGKGVDIYGGGQQGLPYGGSYAQGGIVNRPQMAMVGEQGPEAIVPLGQYPKKRPWGRNVSQVPNISSPYFQAMPAQLQPYGSPGGGMGGSVTAPGPAPQMPGGSWGTGTFDPSSLGPGTGGSRAYPQDQQPQMQESIAYPPEARQDYERMMALKNQQQAARRQSRPRYPIRPMAGGWMDQVQGQGRNPIVY